MNKFHSIKYFFVFIISTLLTGCFESKTKIITSDHYVTKEVAGAFIARVAALNGDPKSANYNFNSDGSFTFYNDGKKCTYSLSSIDDEVYILQSWPGCHERKSYQYFIITVIDDKFSYALPDLRGSLKQKEEYFNLLKTLAAEYNINILIIDPKGDLYFKILGEVTPKNLINFLKIYYKSDMSFMDN